MAASTSRKRKIPDGECEAFIAPKPSQDTASASTPSAVNKTSPAECEYDNRLNDVRANPHKAILEIDTLKEEIDEMADTICKERLARDRLEKEYVRKFEKMKLEFEKQTGTRWKE